MFDNTRLCFIRQLSIIFFITGHEQRFLQQGRELHRCWAPIRRREYLRRIREKSRPRVQEDGEVNRWNCVFGAPAENNKIAKFAITIDTRYNNVL